MVLGTLQVVVRHHALLSEQPTEITNMWQTYKGIGTPFINLSLTDSDISVFISILASSLLGHLISESSYLMHMKGPEDGIT